MRFEIDKKKQSIMIVISALLMIGICAFLLVIVPKALGGVIVGAVYWIIQIIKAVQDYKTYIEFNSDKVILFRRGRKNELYWNDVKRVEYSGIRWLPIFDCLIIHTSSEKLYIEYNFTEYKKAWKTFIDFYKTNFKDALVDKDIPLN